jgi:hypothetical protein
VGDSFDFAGHIMPTLDSRVQVEVTAPSWQTRIVSGRANSVGYFYAPWDSFTLDEPGRWTANVQVWHDGQIGSGEQVDCDPAASFDPQRPCPSGPAINTPSLRGIYDTAPYFHDGSAATLYEAVTRPGSEHDVSSRLNKAEIQDLVSFLLSLPHEP